MKLTLKLVSMSILLIVISLTIDAWTTLRREQEFLKQELQQKAYRIGDSMKNLLASDWPTNGPVKAMEIIERANSRSETLEIRWVWLDAAIGDPHAPHAESSKVRRVTEQGTLHLQVDKDGGRRMLYTYVTVSVDAGRPGAIELSEPMQPIDDYTKASIQRKFVLAAAILLGGGGVTMLLGISMIGAPLNLLSEKARRISRGDLSGPVQLRGRDELSELASTINSMCESLSVAQENVRRETEARIASVEQLRHADRLRTVGQLASGVAHELGTPLNVVSGRAQLISRGQLSQEEIQQSATIIHDQADRMTRIIRHLLNFSRRSPAKRAVADLQRLVEETVNVLIPLAEKQHVTLSLQDFAGPCPASVDAAQIQQVLTNLIVNGIQATAEDGRVTVDIRKCLAAPPEHPDEQESSYWRVSVEDTGEGIPEDIRERLFEPFFTTKQIGDGSGLGLSIAYGIIEDHGGWIQFESGVGRGTRFDFWIPEDTGSHDPVSAGAEDHSTDITHSK